MVKMMIPTDARGTAVRGIGGEFLRGADGAC